MLSLYDILKASKTGIAPDLWTALAGKNWNGTDTGHEVKELTGIPPLSFRADGTPLLDFLISGNMEQTGTPTPDEPITPSECGDRTANLFDTFDIVGQVPSVTNGNLVSYTGGATTSLIPINNPIVTLSLFLTANTYLFLYDENQNYIGNLNRTTGDISSISITGYENAKYARIRSDNYSAYQANPHITLVEGSTAPSSFIPYGYKLPITSGNTTTPIYLSEPLRKIGEYADEVGKTENLWNVPIVQGAVADNGDLLNYSTRVRGEYIPIQPETQYTISCNKAIRTIYAYYNQAKVSPIYTGSSQITTKTFTTPENCNSICVGFMNDPPSANLTPSDIEYVMLNSGSTAKPYQPYGYAVTRYIKKLVLTGEEEWSAPSGDTYRITLNGYIRELGKIIAISSHYIVIPNVSEITTWTTDKQLTFLVSSSGNNYMYIRHVGFTLSNFKSYLAQQYTNGTPVTVWYVLATPTSESIEAPTIPTVKGSQTFDVETSLKPSEVYIKYQG